MCVCEVIYKTKPPKVEKLVRQTSTIKIDLVKELRLWTAQVREGVTGFKRLANKVRFTRVRDVCECTIIPWVI